MATLYNTKISATYSGLVKTIDSAAITAALKELTDGTGLQTGLYINTAGDFKVTSILEWGSLKDTGTGVTITQFVTAADGIGSFNNDTTVPTSAAVKTYVDAVVTASDLDFLGDSNVGTPAVDLDSQNFSILGTANEIETSGNAQTLTIGLPNDVTIADDLTVTDVLTVNGTVLSNIIEGGLQINNSGGSHTVRIKDASGGNLFNTDPTNSRIAINKLTPSTTLDVNGTVTATTYIGDLNGTINTATTATTQTASDNSTKVATTAYVDTLDAASDLDTAGDSGTGDINLNTQSLAVTGTTNQIVTVAANQGISLAFPSTIVIPNGSTATTQSASDNSTKVATTAYVDVLDSASDLDITDGVVTGDVNLNTQSLSILGTTNQVTSTVLNQSVTLSLPSSINVNSASATILETARDISLTGQATATISSFDGSVNVSGAVTLDNNSVTGKVLTGLPTPAAASVLPADSILDGIGKLQSQINGLAGGLRFIGSWNATANSPSLSSGGGEATSGTTTGTTANKLVDSAANFSVTVTVGDQVVNQVDGQTALVTNVDSSTILSLDADIIVSGEAYTIDNTPFLTQGHYYVVSVGGTTSLNGIANWSVGDWVIAGANNEWTQLDHTDVEGVGTVGNIPKWSATGTIADSIMAESGTEITVSGILSTTTNLNSGSNFAVATNKFTANATTGNVAFEGDLAINTNKFTVNATSGATAAAGTITAPTFSGDLNGTINTLTTAVTQAASNNSTLVATTAYVDTAAGLYLPLAGGTMTGAIDSTGDLVLKSDSITALTLWDSGGQGLGKFHNNLTVLGTVGIGMTAGTVSAEIKGRASDGKSLRLWDNAGTDILDLYNNGTNAYINTTHSGGAGNPLIIQTNSVTALTIDTAQNATFAGDVSLGDAKKLKFGAAPDFEIYHNNTTNVNHITSLLDRQLAISSNTINLTNQASTTTYLQLAAAGATFAGNVDVYQATDSQLQIESLNEDATLIINSGADGVGGANREEGFIKFYQDNAEHFTLGKRNNGQFVLLDNVAGQDVITFQDNGGILLTPSNNLTQITGSVGIGAAPLQGKLDILDAGAYSAHTGHGVAINSNASNAYTSMYMGADDSVDAAYIQSAGRNTSFTTKKLLLNPNGGNVGIGNTTAYSRLDVTAPATKTNLGVPSNQTITLSGGGGLNEYNQIGFGYTAGDFSPAVIGFLTTSGLVSTKGALIFALRDSTTAIAPTERMRITSGGDVNIVKEVTAASFISGKGSNSITASGTADIINMSGTNGIYTVAVVVTGGSSIYIANAVFISHAANSEYIKAQDIYDGSNVTLSVSGTNIRITNDGFGTLTWLWSYKFQAFN